MVGTRYYLNTTIDYYEFVNLPYSEQEYFKRVNVEDNIVDNRINDLDIQD